MRPVRLPVLTNVETSDIVPLDLGIAPTNVTVNIEITGGTPTWFVEHTVDDIWDASVTPTWEETGTGTTSDDVAIVSPAVAVRVRNTGTGTVLATVVQAGIAA